MFLAGLFLPVIALPKPAQCSGSVPMDTKHRALTLAQTVLAGSCQNCPVQDPGLLPLSICTSLSLTSFCRAELVLLPLLSDPTSLQRAPSAATFGSGARGHIPFSMQSESLSWAGLGALDAPGAAGMCSMGHCSDPELPSSQQPCHALCLYQPCCCTGGGHRKVKRFCAPSAKFIK